MKKYNINLQVAIKEGNISDYSPSTPIYFNIVEVLPTNVDAQKYLRQRLAEEIKRHFDALDAPIDNKTDDVQSKEDPLIEIPF